MDLRIFLLAFGTLFLAELGDKTQLAVFSLVTQTKSPLSVFLGAGAALLAVTFIGVAFGEWVSRHIPGHYLRLGAGLLFIGIGAFVVWQSLGEVLRAS